jgi:hypothetical protein
MSTQVHGWGFRKRGSMAFPGAITLAPGGTTLSGDLIIANTLTVAVGTAAAPSIRFTGFLTTGLAAPAGVPTLTGTGIARFTWGSLNTSSAPLSMSTNYIEVIENTAPAAPAANRFRFYAVDVAGKTRAAVLFNTGAEQSAAQEP